VEREPDANLVQVDHPEQFPLVTAAEHDGTSQLTATGVVAPDVSRSIPVVSLASGRAVDLRVRLGDTVRKGQLLLRVQSADAASALSDYRKAMADETLAKTQFERARDLYDKGAISQNDFQVASDTRDKAAVDAETTRQRLRLLGLSPDQPTGTVNILAPASGVIVEQNVTDAAGVKTLDNSPNLFTIADLSSVWIVCDAYENDLSQVQKGETAEIRLNAYPGKAFTGRITNIGAVLDPNLRTAKVRIEVPNREHLMRVGMFATATFHGKKIEKHASVPASAVLHLHDRDWVYVPAGNGTFRRTEVTGGAMLPGGRQEILTGISPGQQVVLNALVLEGTVNE
jgi:cobalt-zinc-cadmium efflux system membrane fusion protein